jgi:hypothetical protein
MQVMESDDSDYEADFSGKASVQDDTGKERRRNTEDDEQGADKDDLKGQISKGVATYVWEEGRQRARKAFSLYANIDILRPYYDVEPYEVQSRLLGSLIPRLTLSTEGKIPKVPHELYGPTMLVFTLIAMLLYQMKSAGHTVQEGTLMGTAFATCFGYWFGVASLVWVFSYVCNTRIGMTQILHTLGYALFGHCIVLFLTTLFHPAHSHLFFYALWLAFGGLSTLKMASVLMARTPGRSQKMTLCAIIVALHLLFLLYLHFAYHHVVEDVSEVFNGPPGHHAIEPSRSPLVDNPNMAAVADAANSPLGQLANQSADAVAATMKHSLRVARSNSSVLHRLAQRDTAAVARRNMPGGAVATGGGGVLQDAVTLVTGAISAATNGSSVIVGGLGRAA